MLVFSLSEGCACCLCACDIPPGVSITAAALGRAVLTWFIGVHICRDMASSLLHAKPNPCSFELLGHRENANLKCWRLWRQSLEGDMIILIPARYCRVCWSTRDQHPQHQLCILTTSGWSSTSCSLAYCVYLLFPTCSFSTLIFL